VSQTALGKIGKYGAAATSRPVTAGAYYGERALEEEGQQPGYEYNVNSDDTFGRMLSAESGNQQFAKTGETMTSPKGALGAAQIMPETAPEASALAGEKFDPERLKSDKEYNVKLGRAYFGKMLEDFGDERLAVAAYNAGPGRIRSALSQAEKSGGIWEDFIPDETKGYLRKVFGAATGGRIERASGGSVKMNHIAEADKLIAAADRAKKMHNKSTEPLLNLPDEHVTHALAIANESI
jgi:soluble lytic murein transglycosylase-like protein